MPQAFQNLSALLEWCDSIDFKTEANVVQEAAPLIDEAPPNPEREKLFKYMADLGAQVGAGNEFGRTHKYWFFRPAWETDSALWGQIFGEDDPASVIAFYVSSFFKRDGVVARRRTIILTPNDLIIFEWLIREAAADICRGKGSESQHLLPVMQGAIATACRLEKVLHCAIQWTSPDFLSAVNKAPASLAPYLLRYWSERIDFASELSASHLRQTSIEQARFMAVCLLKHIAPDAGISDLVVPTLSFISDRTIVCARDTIECIEIEADAEELKPLLKLLSVAIYQARDTLFGGVFPFTIHEAKNIIGQMAREKGYWLADFAYYDAESYEPGLDFFGLYSDIAVIHQDGSIRANRSAHLRYEAYRDALASMERDGLRELSSAWWAFFIASQVLAFPGFGLPGRDLQELAKQTASLMNDRMVAKAVQFAVAQERDRPASLASRVSLGLLQELTTETEETAGPLIHLGISGAQIETYLRERIEPSVWAALSEQSRRDLVEAEQLWCRAAPDFGAGRSDWGALIALYSRPIEAEVRSHLGPLLEQLGEAGLCNVSELTLGGCVKGIREANTALRTRSFPTLSEAIKLRVRSLQAFLGTQARFLESIRNRADHGNREEPITAAEFLKWRVAIFQDRLFAVILGSQAGTHI
jgi:hypothetical protein